MQTEIITVNYNTPELIHRLHSSLRKFYPTTPFRVIDGSDKPETFAMVDAIAQGDEYTTLERFDYNIHHGKGMDYAIKSSKHDNVFILDSDTEVLSSELLKHMWELIPDNGQYYSIGNVIHVDKEGFDKPKEEGGIKYIHPYCILINKDRYKKFPPFSNHGAPCLFAMDRVCQVGREGELIHCPELETNISHDWKGTRNKFGMGIMW